MVTHQSIPSNGPQMDIDKIKPSLNHSMVQLSLNWVHQKEEACSMDYLLCSYVATHCNVGIHYSSQQWRQMVKVDEVTKTQGELMLRRAADALLMRHAFSKNFASSSVCSQIPCTLTRILLFKKIAFRQVQITVKSRLSI
jgi:hypothetical protein